MKGKVVLIAGGILVAGSVGYIAYKHLKDSKKGKANDEAEAKERNNQKAEDKNNFSNNTDSSNVFDSAISTIKERHIAASQIIKESLDKIFKEDEGEDIDISDIFDNTDNELNALSK